jgi:hypothetical protein
LTPADKQRIDDYLGGLKAEWRSSPEGIYWHRFFELLRSHAQPDEPPRPFILAGSASSNASKLARLGEQLEWAAQHGCLDEALNYLGSVDRVHWSSCLPEHWDKHSHF